MKNRLSPLAACLAACLVVGAVHAAPKETKAVKKDAPARTVAPSRPASDGWSLGILGGLTVPTGDLSNDPGGQATGFHGGLLLEKSLDPALALNFGLDFHLLDNQPAVENLSPLKIFQPTMNLKWAFLEGEPSFHLLIGVGMAHQSFTATTPDGDTTLSTLDFNFRTGLGTEIPLGESDAILLEAVWDLVFSSPEAAFFPIRIGYKFAL